MTLIKKKLKSQGGASILLALLLLLLCIMVGSSIVASSVSNAGKNKGRRESQQEYFMVKSAIEMVCVELGKLEYKGKYEYSAEEYKCCTNPADKHPIEVDPPHLQESRYVLRYKLLPGQVSGITPGIRPGITPEDVATPLTVYLPESFKNDFAKVLNRLYSVPFYESRRDDSLESPSFDDLPELYNRVYTMDAADMSLRPAFKSDGVTVAEKQITDDDDYCFNITVDNEPLNIYTVDVRAEIIESDLSIKITAELRGTGSNKMEALMTLKTGSRFEVPTDYYPLPSPANPTPLETKNPTPLTWELKYIRKAVDR